MELISPEQYAENVKNKSKEELENINNRLLKEINYLERLSRHPEDSFFEMWQIDTKLNVYKEYLLKIEEIINLNK